MTTEHSTLREFSGSLLEEHYPANRPGAALVVVHRQHEPLVRAYGLREIAAETPMETDTILRIGSLSKQFTAISILLLAEQGRISLSDSILEHLGATAASLKEIRIRHLLSHTSGLPPHLSTAREKGLVHVDLDKQELLELIADEPGTLPPGQKWIYSDLGYVLLGQVVEEVSGKALPDYAQANIFGPLGMANTAYLSDKKLSFSAAEDYRLTEDGYARGAWNIPRPLLGDGAVVSSANDISRWFRALNARRVIKQQHWHQATSPTRLSSGSLAPYGFGWAVGELHGFKVLEHGGNIAGYRSHFLILPDLELFIGIMVNAVDDRPAPSYLASEIASFALDVPLEQDEIQVPKRMLRSYTGAFCSWSGVERTISLLGDKLFSQRAGSRPYELFAVGRDRFGFRGSQTKIRFLRGRDGEVQGLAVSRRYSEQEISLRCQGSSPEEFDLKLNLNSPG